VNDKLRVTAIEAHQEFGKHERRFLLYISQTLKMDRNFRVELVLVNRPARLAGHWPSRRQHFWLSAHTLRTTLLGLCLVSSQQVIQGPVKEIANKIVKFLNTVEFQRSQLTTGNSVA
jgi:hypothetical protein